jgi:hypothetical protein
MDEHSEAAGFGDPPTADGRTEAAPAEAAPADAPAAAVPAAPAPPEPTGVASVDAALDRLRDAESAPLEEHVEIYDDVQRRLHDALAELDDE